MKENISDSACDSANGLHAAADDHTVRVDHAARAVEADAPVGEVALSDDASCQRCRKVDEYMRGFWRRRGVGRVERVGRCVHSRVGSARENGENGDGETVLVALQSKGHLWDLSLCLAFLCATE